MDNMNIIIYNMGMEKILLLDSNSLINRAFYALPNLRNHKGQYTGAIFGYMNMLLKLIDTYKPTYVIATFDKKSRLFRKDIYEDYKGNRKPMPQELASQMQPMKDILSKMEIPIVELDCYEADDIIGTIAKKYQMQTYIVTGDKDSLQLIDNTTTVLLTKKGVTEIAEYTPEKLKEEGLDPSQIIDLKSLMGDTSDNIPGVPGVGEKTARDLLEKYSTLDGVYEHIEEIKGKLKEKLELNKDSAYMSYKLATINTNSPVEIDLDKARTKNVYDITLKTALKELELNKIIERMEFKGEEIPKIEELVNIESISEEGQLDILISKIMQAKQFSIVIEDNVEIALSKNEAYTIEISHDLFGGLFLDDVIKRLKPIFEDNSISKYFYDVKNIMHQLDNYDIELKKPYDDVLIKEYIVDANRNYKDLSDLISTYNISSEMKSAAIFVLNDIIDKSLEEIGIKNLYNEIEIPLVEVLFDMEKQGFRVNKKIISELSEKFEEELLALTKVIYDYAGEEFNINSPKQLGVILFEKLGLKGGKKTKTGYSTSVEVLKELEDENPIIGEILRYREIAKLKSTYLDGLLPLIDKNDKLHTVFKQTVTATGRLSSTEPNLQNIPVRKPEGKQIRELFISSEGNKLVCADYSQIELRLMAAMSGDEGMIKAFNSGVDIHTRTAAKILGIREDQVTPDLRRQAKAVNFGIIYGISDFGLAKDLDIPMFQARNFIKSYFEQFPRIKEYMEELKAKAKELGYAVTYYGRRRYIPELTASSRIIQMFGERVAMNMPLQGTASDIIKLAMIKVYNKLKDGGYKAKLIMQVHDELIIDCPEEELDAVKEILKNSMESVVKLDVNLEAEVGIGYNWLEAK